MHSKHCIYRDATEKFNLLHTLRKHAIQTPGISKQIIIKTNDCNAMRQDERSGQRRRQANRGEKEKRRERITEQNRISDARVTDRVLTNQKKRNRKDQTVQSAAKLKNSIATKLLTAKNWKGKQKKKERKLRK